MTSSGERLHHDSLTCAHRKYPFGTKLKVKNLTNGKEVVVRVTDRGPYGRGIIIDLSYAAAKELGMLSQGVAAVIIEPVRETTVPFKYEEERKIPQVDIEMIDNGHTLFEQWKEAYQGKKLERKKLIKGFPKHKNARTRKDTTMKAQGRSTQKTILHNMEVRKPELQKKEVRKPELQKKEVRKPELQKKNINGKHRTTK